MSIKSIVDEQKQYFRKNNTIDVNFRIKTLEKLKRILTQQEGVILNALNKDLKKSPFEGYATELGMVYEELNNAIKGLKKWAKKERVKSPIFYFPSKSYIYKEPYGVALIIGPFNYPFQLILSPLIGAIAAGNCAVLKPSEYSIETSKVIEKIINENFESGYIKVVDPMGGKEIVTELLESEFDYIFFTGSVKVGKIVMERAAKRLIPVTLELGGKSPCIVDGDANISMAAKRIVWGKFLNAGQTCVAPDYLYVNNRIKDKLLKEIVKEIKLQFGEKIIESPDYPRLISKKEVDRISSYINEGDIYYGGEVDRNDKYISPTILINIKSGSRILEEEIFGPIFPVYEFDYIDEVINKVNDGEKPLALYYFSENKDNIEKVINKTTSGGVTVNDTVIHVASAYLPFGGVGNSGMGAYHGKASFDVFTHKKSVMKRSTSMEFPFRFAPYNNRLNLLRKIMK